MKIVIQNGGLLVKILTNQVIAGENINQSGDS
jgi:hypothetical protein